VARGKEVEKEQGRRKDGKKRRNGKKTGKKHLASGISCWFSVEPDQS